MKNAQKNRSALTIPACRQRSLLPITGRALVRADIVTIKSLTSKGMYTSTWNKRLRLVERQNVRHGTLTRMISKGFPWATRSLNASTARLPFSAIPTVWPYFSRILTASFWFTKLSSARRMSKVTSLGADTGLTVFDSRAEMRAEERSWAVTWVLTCELILLSKRHLTGNK